MKKYKVKFVGIMISIILTLFNWTLHFHHSEEIKDEIILRFEKLFQTFYSKAIGDIFV